MPGKRKKKSAAALDPNPVKNEKQRNRRAKRKLPAMLPLRRDMCPAGCPKLLLGGVPPCSFICRDFGPLKTHEDGGPVRSARCPYSPACVEKIADKA